jgi:hypothetical protein
MLKYQLLVIVCVKKYCFFYTSQLIWGLDKHAADFRQMVLDFFGFVNSGSKI